MLPEPNTMDGDSPTFESTPASPAVESKALPLTGRERARRYGPTWELRLRGAPPLETQAPPDQGPEPSLPGPRPVILVSRSTPGQGQTPRQASGPGTGQSLPQPPRPRQGQAPTSTLAPATVSAASFYTAATAGSSSCPPRCERAPCPTPSHQSQAPTRGQAPARLAPTLPRSAPAPQTLVPPAQLSLAEFQAEDIPALLCQFQGRQGLWGSHGQRKPLTTTQISATYPQTTRTVALLSQPQQQGEFPGSCRTINSLSHDEIRQFLGAIPKEPQTYQQMAGQQMMYAQGGNISLTTPRSQNIYVDKQGVWAHAAPQQVQRSGLGLNQALPQAPILPTQRRTGWQRPERSVRLKRRVDQLELVQPQPPTHVRTQEQGPDARQWQHLQPDRLPEQPQWQFPCPANEQPHWQAQTQLSTKPGPQTQDQRSHYQMPDQRDWQSHDQTLEQPQWQVPSRALVQPQSQPEYQPREQARWQGQVQMPTRPQYQVPQYQAPVLPHWQGQDKLEHLQWKPQYQAQHQAPQESQPQTNPGNCAPPLPRPPSPRPPAPWPPRPVEQPQWQVQHQAPQQFQLQTEPGYLAPPLPRPPSPRPPAPWPPRPVEQAQWPLQQQAPHGSDLQTDPGYFAPPLPRPPSPPPPAPWPPRTVEQAQWPVQAPQGSELQTDPGCCAPPLPRPPSPRPPAPWPPRPVEQTQFPEQHGIWYSSEFGSSASGT